MPKLTVEQHLAAAVEYQAVASSPDPERAAFETAARKIREAMKEDPSLTEAVVGERIGKSERYVRELLA